PGGPGYGPSGPGGPGYGPGGPGEPPKQSRAGLFAIIGVVLLLIVGVAVALVLTLGGDDDSSDDKSKEDESSKTEDPTPTESAEPTESSEPTGDTISGSSYTFTVPDGWSDVTSEVSGQQASVDSAIAAGSSISGSNANIIVEAGPAGGETDPEAARATWKSNLETSTGSTARDIGNGEIGGTEAIGVRLERTNEGGVDIVQIGYLTIKNDSVVAVTISSTTDNEDAAMEKFEEVSDSWDWQ
ncbi:MAG: hypothetical protein L0H93_19555, partial [Nocardioides sp.]|nr:hypothetical protein [Nocardioides sp.]